METTIKNNEILYTSVNGKKIATCFRGKNFGKGLHIVSHTYEDGVGRVVYDGEVTKIANLAFHDCTSLSSITIPNSVTSIGKYAFVYCTSFSSITIPNSVTSIGEGAFYYCTSLRMVTIGNSVTSMGEYAFYYCSSLESVIIPNSVKSIGTYAFNGCSSLESVTIPNSVKSIGWNVFIFCDLLHNKLSQSGRCFKAFNADMTCRGFKYEEGKSYHCGRIELCKRGFHYCTSILELFNYYYGEEGKDIVIHEVFPSGEISIEYKSTKHCCSDIKIGRRIKFSEIGEFVREMLIDFK